MIPGWERYPGGGNGNPLQYSCLEKPTDRGAWRAIVHEVTKSRTRLSTLSPDLKPWVPSLTRGRDHLSPEDSEFAARVAQPLAQQPDTCVPQGVVGQIKVCEGLVDTQGRRNVLTSFACEAAAVEPVEDEKWLKQRQQFVLESVSFIGNQGDVFRDQFKKEAD